MGSGLVSSQKPPGRRSVCPDWMTGLGSCQILGIENESDQAERAISTGKLRALLRFHTRPINVVVFHDSSGRTRFEGGFPLRCFQRLSFPHIATLQCCWRNNRSTSGASIPVLSY